MTHLSSEELVHALYEDGAGAWGAHLRECGECREQLRLLKETLAVFDAYRAPERGISYPQDVWNRLAPQLPAPQKNFWKRVWILAPALAALLCVAFGLGFWTEHKRTVAISKARERVLLIAMSDHLERSQIVLADLVHLSPGSIDLPEERERARDLVGENRLLRQTALHLGDRSHAALLDDLERALVDLANTPDDAPLSDLKLLQTRIEKDGLLWKVRLTSADARRKGSRL